jgi:nucleotide-binding universal stress UspA family protein
MQDTWIVGVDGSASATGALRWAATNAAPHNSRVIALNAWHLPMPFKALMIKRGIDVDRVGLAATAANEIDEVIASLGDLGAGIEAQTVEGHPATVLLDHATSAALLVLGRRGISELKHLVLGSVARYCATHCTVPVVVVPPDWEPRADGEIIVGFDGSENSRDALRWALDFAAPDDTVRAVVAIDVAPWLDEESTRQRFPDEVRAETTRMTAALDDADPEQRAHRDIQLHSPQQALSTATADAALVVVGGHGLGRGGPKMLGSVSTWILHQTPCPVVVVPRRHPAPG